MKSQPYMFQLYIHFDEVNDENKNDMLPVPGIQTCIQSYKQTCRGRHIGLQDAGRKADKQAVKQADG